MNANSVTETELLSWIEKSLNGNGLKNYEISISGKSEKGDGYVGEIVFVRISGTSNENKKKSLYWVIKHGKKNDHLRNSVPMKAAFDNEIYVYDKIFPVFKQFQLHKNILHGFHSVPKCYNTLILENMEVLVLDNLKERGYELHDRKKTFSIGHLEAILKEYGKLHALSFALREQRPEQFNKLADFDDDVFRKFIEAESFKETIGICVQKALTILKEKNELHLLDKLEKIATKDPADIIIDLMAEHETQSVIVHGDCWNNNFMFKYQRRYRMNANSVTEAELFSWVEKSLNGNGLKNYEISISGKSEKGDGYVGEVVFVCINGTSNENKKKSLHWVIKHGKKNDHLRNSVPMKAAFDNEIYVYDKIFPVFQQFQLHKNILDGFNSVPKCYNTLILDNMEVLVLDNLKERGYELHDRKKSFNIDHLEAILKEYGKLHALSFALREQRPEQFNKLADFDNDVFKQFMEAESAKETIGIGVQKALTVLKERHELHLLDKLEKIATKDPVDIIIDLMAEHETQSVIIHGDCWNNNFMFKYQDADRTTPMNVAILDWQISALRSPVFDLSYLIYATSSSYELDKFDELLKFYHTSFSNFLKELGGNPEEMFSYSSLQAHWRKYSLFGLLIVLVVLPMALSDKEDVVAFENLKEGEKFSDMMRSDIKDKDLYFERMKPVVSHYFEYTCN